MVTAGLANEVDAVNQYPAVIKRPTVQTTASGFQRRVPSIVAIKPKAATNSENQ